MANHLCGARESMAASSLTMAARTMGPVSVMTSLVVVLVVLAFSRAAAQGNGCSSVMMTLSPCMDFISSKAPEPGISCCSVIAGVVQTDPRCLCMVLDGTATSFGISINQTRAMELPGVCKVKAPPISQCAGVPGAPAPTPSNEAATAEGEEVEAAADSPSGNGSSSSTNSKNAASLMATMLIPTCVLLCLLSVDTSSLAMSPCKN